MAIIGDRNIISVTHITASSYASRGSTSSWTEFNTNYRITVTPKRSDSLLLFDFNFIVQSSVEHILQSYRIYNVTDSVYLDNNGNLSNRNWVHGQSRGQYNGDNANTMHVMARYSPNSTSAKTYGLHHINAGGTTYIGYSNADGTSAVQWRHSPIITCYEIEDI